MGIQTLAATAKQAASTFRKLKAISKDDPAQQKRDNLVAMVSIAGMSLRGPAPKGANMRQPAAVLIVQLQPAKKSLMNRVSAGLKNVLLPRSTAPSMAGMFNKPKAMAPS